MSVVIADDDPHDLELAPVQRRVILAEAADQQHADDEREGGGVTVLWCPEHVDELTRLHDIPVRDVLDEVVEQSMHRTGVAGDERGGGGVGGKAAIGQDRHERCS